ncbi:MAG TPA: MG2 domain-containing protein [Mucilaginibacter sp.]|jgi:TonB-dependent SusC/RagA subfamily outer membrane receptor
MNRTFFTIKFIFIAICYCSFAWCQDNNIPSKIITAKLASFLADRPTEKAYLQFDKPYYAAGDTMYFKAYVTKGEEHQLSDISGVLHVDLINTKDKIDQSLKLQLDSGIAWGDFALPDSLPPGNYRVRAYTQWMRNEGGGAFFYQTITVASITNNKIPESIARHPAQTMNNKADVQFFPEGGNLVSGNQSKVAFKAIGTNGLGINVKGAVMDNGNNEVCTFSSVHLGMGYFYLEPQEGKTYKAQLTYANGEQSTVNLPNPVSKGIVLSINNDSIPKASVTIAASAAYYQENRKRDFTLLIYSGGIATTVTCKLDSPVITMFILKRRLHTGIATVTLFLPTGESLCERLLFVQNYDQLNLGVSSDKAVYAKREKVNINLNAINRAGNPAEGHFSVSVTDESKVPIDENAENTIISNLLLTSDLQGYVEQPNYYFADTSADARKNLDVLMLTQGYRRFTWKQVLDNNYPPIVFQPEKALEISGMVKSLFGKPINKGTITLLPSKGGPLLSSLSDDKGIFHFSNLVFNDTTHFVLSAVNAKSRNSTKITYFTDKPAPLIPANQLQNTQTVPDTALAAFVENDKLQQRELLNYGHAKGIMLKEVKIKDKKLDDQYKTQSLAGAGHADQVMHADEIGRIQGPLAMSLDGRLRGVKFIPYGVGKVPVLTINTTAQLGANAVQPMLVIIDGAEGGDINALNASDVETVEVLRYASAVIYGMDGGNGVLVITTKQGGMDPKDIASIGVLPIAPMGFYKAREFYSPKYVNTILVGKQRDFRSTIYWKPEIKTDKDGNASFDYYNADGTGTYKVVVEGIDDKGNIGRQVYWYKVE